MSYILDALRKAERERGIKQVPTLMTDHAPRSVHRNRVWAILSVLVVFAAVAAGYFIYSQKTTIPPPANHIAEKSETNPLEASTIDSSAPKAATSQQPSAIQGSGLPSERSAGTTITPGAPITIVPRSVSGERPVPNGRRMIPPDEEEDFIPPDEAGEIPMPPQEAMRNLQRLRPAPAGPKTAETKPEPLQEAVGKMTLSLLMFADTKEERMVFINGNKYVEGDYVEGIYLLESITIDGAILSYQGERALLQPTSK